MASGLDVKLVVKHLANGSFGENLCRVCLTPLTACCENIFTNVCKEGKEYCIADVLKELCDIKISNSDHYNVCADCFMAASNAYKFYLNAKANEEVLHFYVDQMREHVHSVNVPDDMAAESLCISLPIVALEYFDYDIKDIISEKKLQEPHREASKVTVNKVEKPNFPRPKVKKEKIDNNDQDDEDIVIVMNEKGQASFFKLQPDGSLVKREYDERCRKAFEAIPKPAESGKKKRRKREPMTSKQCLRCPIRYRFIAKLKEHMKAEHGAILYACKICEAITEDIEEYEFHLKTHTNIYQCNICNAVFKKRETMTDHLKEHRENRNGNSPTGDFVCVICGLILSDEDSLRLHTDMNHYKKYACYYCGRTYKGISSFEKHVKKHETYLKKEAQQKSLEKWSMSSSEARDMIARAGSGGAGAGEPARSEWTCEQCGRGFRGERALLWHARLHNNERPFTCDVCGRGFVSLNRRNQHALCAHTVPTRRCPLCPALFHLRSMVNTHIKKVHLKRHKRRTRAARPQHVFWHTEPVPVQELSVELQSDILDLQAATARQLADPGNAYIMPEVKNM